MRKQISIRTINRKALNTLLPLGAHAEIKERLKSKHGKEVSLRTIGRAFIPEYPITELVSLIIKEALLYRDDLLKRDHVEVSVELVDELQKTGS